MARCSALNRDGHPCGMQAIRGEPFCLRHSGKVCPGDIVEAIADRRAFGKFLRDVKTWSAWITVLKSIYGVALSPADLELFHRCTGRQAPLSGGYDEIFLTCGRQGGKSTVASLIAAWEAVFGGWESRLNPGETFEIFSISNTKEQAHVVFEDIRRFLGPFKRLIKRETQDVIELTNNCRISVKASDYHSVRGFGNIVLCVLDEAEFFPNDSVGDVIAALSPAIASGGKLIAISSRNGSRGYMQNIRKRYWAQDDAPVLVWKADTLTMNPCYSEAKIERDSARDSRMRAEYDPFYKYNEEEFFREDVVRSLVIPAPPPFDKGVRYTAYVDSSAGMSDSTVLAVAHAKDEVAYVDVLTEFAPGGDFIKAVEEMADTLNRFSIREIFGDRYAFGILESLFRRHGIELKMSQGTSSDFYFRLKALVVQEGVVFPNCEKLIDELCRLELVKTAGGTERVDHPRNFHDDMANAVAGAVFHVCKALSSPRHETYGVIVQKKQHPIPEVQKEREEREIIDDMEYEFQKWLESTEGGVCLPIKDGRPVEFIEIDRRKIGRHPSDKPS